MIFWIKKFAAIVGLTTFFVLFVMTLAACGDLSWESLASSFVRALTGAMLLWVVGIVIADILFKGIISDLEYDRRDMAEGGLVQQMQMIKEQTSPGGSLAPFDVPGQQPGRTEKAALKLSKRRDGEAE